MNTKEKKDESEQLKINSIEIQEEPLTVVLNKQGHKTIQIFFVD